MINKHQQNKGKKKAKRREKKQKKQDKHKVRSSKQNDYSRDLKSSRILNFGFQMVFDKMAPICPDYKWLGFWISDPI